MVEDYKRDAVNNVIIELYAQQENKYIGKHRDLIERAKFGNTEWRRMKEEMDEKMAKRMRIIEDQNLPVSLKRSIDKMYAHYNKFMDVKDAQMVMVEVMQRVFDDAIDAGGDAESSSSEE